MAQFAPLTVACEYVSRTLFADDFQPVLVALTDLKLTQLRQREIEDGQGPPADTVEGGIQAVLSAYGERPRSFSANELAVARILARHATAAIGSAQGARTSLRPSMPGSWSVSP